MTSSADPAGVLYKIIRLINISSNGLLAWFQDVSGGARNGDILIFRRANTGEGLRFDHLLTPNSMGTNKAIFFSGCGAMSRTGQFIISGYVDADIGATNAGHIEILEYYPEAD